VRKQYRHVKRRMAAGMFAVSNSATAVRKPRRRAAAVTATAVSRDAIAAYEMIPRRHQTLQNFQRVCRRSAHARTETLIAVHQPIAARDGRDAPPMMRAEHAPRHFTPLHFEPRRFDG